MANKGFVYIVESPSDTDLAAGRTEGRVLSEALSLAGIPHEYNLSVSRSVFEAALTTGLIERWEVHSPRLPILHLSLHGNSDGVQLTDKTFMPWKDLRTLLHPVTQGMAGGLLICMSSCFGASGCRMAMQEDAHHPFWALVGHYGEAKWADAAIAYATFYQLFFKGTPIDQCINAMKIASGDHQFAYFQGAHVKKEWATYSRRQSLADMLRTPGILNQRPAPSP